MSANNKISAWLDAKTPEEKEDLLKKLVVFLQSLNDSTGCESKDYWKSDPKFYRQNSYTTSTNVTKAATRKERLTENILMYGLWQSKEQVNEQLSKLKTKKEKVKAL